MLVCAPDVALVALRSEQGKLEALSLAGSKFELTRWLEHDGDGRPAHEAATGTGFRCDSAGCVARSKGRIVAVPRHPSALADDCARADILVLRWPRDSHCAAKGLVIDYFDVRRQGAHALYASADGIKVRTVADARGVRPWTRTQETLAAGTSQSRPWLVPNRIALFAASAGLLGPERARPRPEIEDDDMPSE